MISYAMLYWVAVGVPVFLASCVLATLLRRYGHAERHVWLTGLGLAFIFPVVGLMQRPAAEVVAGAASRLTGAGTSVIGLPEIVVIPEGASGAGMSQVLVALWLAASLVLGLRLVVAAIRLALAGRSWRAGTLDGVPVWHTERMGPAVAGLARPRVLVPAWLAEMPEHRRSLVLLHEKEHIRAGDPWLMLIARLAPVVAPWNPVVWQLSTRLLRAIELDCDRRVLRQRPDVRAYGSTLIEISARDHGRLVAVAAFAESEAPLRSRILNMTAPSRTVSIVALLASMVFGVFLMVAAFEIPVPTIRAELQIGPQPVSAAVPDPPDAQRGQDAAEEVSTDDEPVAAPVVPRAEEEAVPAEDEIARLRARAEELRAQVAALEVEWASELDRTEAELRPVDEVSADEPEISTAPTFTPFTVAPTLQNMREVQRALVDEYPTRLRDAGIGGRVLVWFFIDAEGRVQQTQINESSGFEAIDQAALNVADVYRFTPALNRDERVAVWVALPITFQVR